MIACAQWLCELGMVIRQGAQQLFAAAIVIAITMVPASTVAHVPASDVHAEERLFPIAQHVLAEFEFDNNALDSSGNQRHATLLGGSFATTTCGIGLVVGQSATNGLDWSAYANLLKHPYTVEIILTPQNTTNWSKLFSFDDRQDSGWYYKNQGVQAYPNAVLGAGTVRENQRHYLAFVSTSANTVDVYFQGALLGSTNASFTAPPTQAIFFKDDTAVRGEDLRATVDALRISSVSRTASEISAVQQQVAACSGYKLFLPLLQK